MSGATLDLGWGALIAILAIIAGLIFIIVFGLVRAQRSRRFRIGVFIERDFREDNTPKDE